MYGFWLYIFWWKNLFSVKLHVKRNNDSEWFNSAKAEKYFLKSFVHFSCFQSGSFTRILPLKGGVFPLPNNIIFSQMSTGVFTFHPSQINEMFSNMYTNWVCLYSNILLNHPCAHNETRCCGNVLYLLNIKLKQRQVSSRRCFNVATTLRCCNIVTICDSWWRCFNFRIQRIKTL